MAVILQSVVVNSRGGELLMNYNNNPVLRLEVLTPQQHTVIIIYWQDVVIKWPNLLMQISMKEKKRNSLLLLPFHYLIKSFPRHPLYLEHLREAFHALHILLVEEGNMEAEMEDHLLLILVPCYHLLCRLLVVA